jgi:protein gp37
MSEHSAIEWTEATWNPWSGCTEVSEGCDNCYMMTMKRRFGQNPHEVVRSKTTFNSPLKWKEPKVIFTCSMSDFFHVDADKWRGEAWEIIRATPQHTYQILTKRPGRIARHLPADWGEGYANVWLGTSAENDSVTHRIAHLLKVPAAIHFLSAEPLLGSLNLLEYVSLNGKVFHRAGYTDALDWVIVGGESGHHARPMDLDWARSLRDQCTSTGTAFFLKQLGGRGDKRGHEKALLDGKRYTEMPSSSTQVSGPDQPKKESE